MYFQKQERNKRFPRKDQVLINEIFLFSFGGIVHKQLHFIDVFVFCRVWIRIKNITEIKQSLSTLILQVKFFMQTIFFKVFKKIIRLFMF